MKFLFDQNLSHVLVVRLADLFPASVHVRQIGLAKADDRVLWDYSKAHDLAIVTKDSDLHQLSFLYGHPPKIVWIQRGNCSTGDIEMILRDHYKDVLSFEQDAESSFLALK